WVVDDEDSTLLGTAKILVELKLIVDDVAFPLSPGLRHRSLLSSSGHESGGRVGALGRISPDERGWRLACDGCGTCTTRIKQSAVGLLLKSRAVSEGSI